MDRRNPWTIASALVLIAVGVTWMIDNVTDIQIPIEWVLPALIVLAGLLMLFGRGSGGGPGDGRGHGTDAGARRSTPSQFERDDAPRVP